MTRLHELAEHGQAVWFDFIRRSHTASGELRDLVDRGVRGVTSNPAIFEKAIAGSDDYDDALARLVARDQTVEASYEALVIEDIRSAADVLAPVYEDTDGADGYVSLEVDPRLARDTEGTLSAAQRLFAAVDRPNAMIKIPATPEGMPAIEAAVAAGININVTLIFSVGHYEAAAEAYQAGMEARMRSGADLGRVASVASLFVSRLDTAVDAALAERGLHSLQGRAAVDNARLTYDRFGSLFSGERWERLAAGGARVQRPLWASTGTKNRAYADTLYVDSLIGPHTVNTVPPATLEAFLDHGVIAPTVGHDLDGARARMAELAGRGIDLDAITTRLQDDGVTAFEVAFEKLLASLAAKHEGLRSAR